MRPLLLAVLSWCCVPFFVSAQSYTWWEETVRWDGVTPWERYIVFTPGFLGPNALPVPRVTNGSIDSVNTFGVSGHFYFSNDDHTQDIALYANYCLVKKRFRLMLFGYPLNILQ
jgi:hypothetical protein